MGTLRLLTYFEFEKSDGRVVYGGSRSKYQELTVSDPCFDEEKSLAVNTTWDAWGFTTEQPISDFDLLWIMSDKSGLYVELTTDANNGVGDEIYTVPLAANIPLILSADDSYANYTADFAGGTADVIDRIRVRNPSGNSAGTAIVRVALFT